MRTVIVFFSIAVAASVCDAQWLQQNSNTTKNLYGVTFTDANTGTVVGDSGTILRTTNGGTNWTLQSSGTTKLLRKVQFLNANLGWAVGDSGTIIHTTNGGTSWASQNSGTANCLLGISFTDAMTGWVAGGQVFFPYYGGIILQTTNGGANWASVYTGPANLRSVYFVNRDTGYAVGDTVRSGVTPGTDGIILRTTNGGMSWDRYVFENSLSNSQMTGLESTERCLLLVFNFFPCVQFTDNLTGWILGETYIVAGMGGMSVGVILNTTNAGVTWSANASVSHTDFRSSHLVNSSTGWVVGNRTDGFGSDAAAIWLTTDAGSSWNTQFLEPSIGTLWDIDFVDEENGWAVGDNGTILHTANGGLTFVEGERRDEVPTVFSLWQNYPNPFNPSTTIRYALPHASFVTLTVYNQLGQQVAQLVNEQQHAGYHDVVFRGDGLASGVYFYRLEAGSFVSVKKLILLK